MVRVAFAFDHELEMQLHSFTSPRDLRCARLASQGKGGELISPGSNCTVSARVSHNETSDCEIGERDSPASP